MTEFDPATGDFLQPGAEPDEAPDEATRGGWQTFWWVVLIVDFIGLGFLLLNNIAIGLAQAFAPDGDLAQSYEQELLQSTQADQWLNAGVLFVMAGLIPFLWLLGTRRKPLEGALKYLGLRASWKDAAIGAGIGLACFLVLIVVSMISILITDGVAGLEALNNESAESNPTLESMLRTLTWPLAIAIGLASGVGEEVLFRGVFQKRMRWWGQGLLFGVAHAGYGTVEQVLFPLGLGMLFGYLRYRGNGLLMMIAAHFTFNFVQLALSLVYG